MPEYYCRTDSFKKYKKIFQENIKKGIFMCYVPNVNTCKSMAIDTMKKFSITKIKLRRINYGN